MKTKKFDLLNVFSNKKVLYAENDEEILKKNIEILKFFFKEVVVVINEKEALDKFENDKYDVLIFDIFMPKFDGIEVIKRVRKKDNNIPIIVISAYIEQEYLWRVIELKITKYLTKPCSKDVIIKALEVVSLELTENKTEIKLNKQCVYNPYLKIIYKDKKEIKLSINESRLLEYFIKHSNQVISYNSIYYYIWNVDIPSKEAIKFIIKELRKKIGKEIIENIYGIGYIFKYHKDNI